MNGCAFHVNSKYKPIGAIGQGSYGVVCSVQNTETNEKLAIKKIKPMAGDEWDATHTLREIRLMKELGSHENIIKLKDLSMSEEKDELYIMMELVDTDLHRLLQSQTALSSDHTRILMYQLLHGIKAMHENGILHRDLKPGNLLVNKDCELKITDFGLARQIPVLKSSINGKLSCNEYEKETIELQGSSSSSSSQMTEYVITRWYRPPELILSPNGKYTTAIDMWSVGCILGEMINRKPLFPGNDFMDQLKRIFQIVNIPHKNKREYSIEKDALKFLESLPRTNCDAMKRKCKNATPEALDLLKNLLCFNPSERYSVQEALSHPYFSGIEDDWGEIPSLNISERAADELNFETKSYKLSTLRQLIKNEVTLMTSSNLNSNEDKLKLLSLNSDSFNYQSNQGFELCNFQFHVSSKYRGKNIIGEGVNSIVCAAENVSIQQNVAIKKIFPMELRATHILREIQIMKKLSDNFNIISLVDICTCLEKDEVYLITPECDADLEKLIKSQTILEPLHIQAILYQLLSGIRSMHEAGFIHRDLKPSNCLINEDCHLLISDFGLSRQLPHDETKKDKVLAPLTEDFTATLWYLAPEIVLCTSAGKNASEAMDIWSVGCIMAELFERKPLFPGNDFLDQITKIFSIIPSTSLKESGLIIAKETESFVDSLPLCPTSALKNKCTSIPDEGINLLRQLLCINPKQRITAAQALQHPFFQYVKKSWTQCKKSHSASLNQGFNEIYDANDLKENIMKEIRSFHIQTSSLNVNLSSVNKFRMREGHMKEEVTSEKKSSSKDIRENLPQFNSESPIQQNNISTEIHEVQNGISFMKPRGIPSNMIKNIKTKGVSILNLPIRFETRDE